MAAISDRYLRGQLEHRRKRLRTAVAQPAASPVLGNLLREVDSALARMDSGQFGICEQCHDTIEADRLLADPLVKLCLDHLTTEQQRALEKDLELAARIQRALLPSRESRAAGWQIQYHWQPLGMVSGDYCDLIDSGNGEVLFFLGDVAGKGVAASMLMTHLHAMFRSLTSAGAAADGARPASSASSLAELVCLANHVFSQSVMAGQFATLVGGRAASTGEVDIVNAGHLPALVARRDGVSSLHSTGLPLGLASDACATFERVKLEPGETLFLYTDGLSETFNAAGDQYGDARLSEFLTEHHQLPPGELISACLRDVREFASAVPPADDLTIMVLRHGS